MRRSGESKTQQAGHAFGFAGGIIKKISMPPPHMRIQVGEVGRRAGGGGGKMWQDGEFNLVIGTVIDA